MMPLVALQEALITTFWASASVTAGSTTDLLPGCSFNALLNTHKRSLMKLVNCRIAKSFSWVAVLESFDHQSSSGNYSFILNRQP